MGPLSEVASLTTHAPEDTQSLGAAIGKRLREGDVILLQGQLGAGKTCLTQGIAWGLGLKEYVMSPSFVLVREYQGRIPLYHMDLYRLERLGEISDLGLDHYFRGGGACVIEWANRGSTLLPEENLTIDISYTSDTDRTLTLTAHGDRFAGMLVELIAVTRELDWNFR